jgi:hypothetical protein
MSTTPEIVTIDVLKGFKQQLVNSLGLFMSKEGHNYNSIIQSGNNYIQYTANSVIVGSGHKTDNTDVEQEKKGLKNIFITGQNNIANSWNQAIFGAFNEPNEQAALIIGNGTSDLNRKNSFTIYKNGDISINDLLFTTSTNSLVLTNGTISYGTVNPAVTASWNSYITYVKDQLTDNTLVSVDLIKPLVEICNAVYSVLPEIESPDEILDIFNDATSWRASVVQDLVFDADNNASAPEGCNTEETAVSIKSALELAAQIKNIEASYSDNELNKVKEDLQKLKEQVSYLISSLTVDKISNASYKGENEELIEYYTVGIADYALDRDTQFIFDNTVESTIIPAPQEN